MLNQTIESTRQKRILVFLSIMHENGKTYEYSCPDGSYVSGGSLSSEAPIRYLIQHDRGIKNVICIVTDDASNAYSFVSSFLEKSGVSTTPIRFDAGMDFEKDVLPKVIDVISPNDEIYLETTGGFRDAVFKLNLIANILRYRGINVVGAVYSSLSDKSIADVTSFMSPFLINGLSEFSRFCSVTSLKEHFHEDSELSPLLTAMESLSESIALCQTDNIDKEIGAINAELDNLRHDCDTQTGLLLDIFSEKFSCLSTVPDIIEWCLDNNFIQQALTVYNERIPEFVIDKTSLLNIKNTRLDSSYDSYKAINDLFNLGIDYPEITESPTSPQAQLRRFVQAHKAELLTNNLGPNACNDLPTDVRMGVRIIKVLINSLMQSSPYSPEYVECNCQNNCSQYRQTSSFDMRCKGCVNTNSREWINDALQYTETESVLKNAINKLVKDTTGHERIRRIPYSTEFGSRMVNRNRLQAKRPIEIITCILRLSSDELKILMGLNSSHATDYDINENYYYTLVGLENILNASEYSTDSLADLKQFLMDYLYARKIRNRVCHADIEGGHYSAKLMNHLRENDRYPDKMLDTGGIKRILVASLDLIRKYQFDAK